MVQGGEGPWTEASGPRHLGGDTWEETLGRRHLGGDTWEEIGARHIIIMWY